MVNHRLGAHMKERVTRSEAVFEDFCRLHGIPCERITVGTTRSPDYRIFPCGEAVICEVKEIEPTREEKQAQAALERGEPVSFGGIVGARVRKKITDGAPQIRKYAKGRCPGVLVLWEADWVPHHLTAYNIKAAMYGFDAIVYAVPKDPEKAPYPVDRKSGGKRRVTDSHNTSLSAVAALRTIDDRIECRVYHNVFAAIRLRPALLQLPDVWHYKLRQGQVGQFDEWEHIAGRT